jgi:hypothetical protein
MMKLCEVECGQTLQVFVKLRMPSCPDLFGFEPLRVFQQFCVLFGCKKGVTFLMTRIVSFTISAIPYRPEEGR